uniref:Uncharacterized protein n=1 Tax=Oryza barthii TaxID=65489 RepID=A0A0D3GK80_9ORYZ
MGPWLNPAQSVGLRVLLTQLAIWLRPPPRTPVTGAGAGARLEGLFGRRNKTSNSDHLFIDSAVGQRAAGPKDSDTRVNSK